MVKSVLNSYLTVICFIFALTPGHYLMAQSSSIILQTSMAIKKFKVALSVKPKKDGINIYKSVFRLFVPF